MARRLLLAYVTLILVVLVILEVPLAITYRDREIDDLRASVQSDAVILASFAEDNLESGAPASDRLRRLAMEFTERTGGRVVVVDAAGIEVLDSDPIDPGSSPRDFSTRPEIAAALTGRVATGTRGSTTLDTRLLYVAVPVASSGVVFGAVRVTFPTSTVDARVRAYWLSLVAIGLAVLAAATVVGFALARWVVAPLRRVEATTASLGSGALDSRIEISDGPPEVRRLAASVNEMAGRLEELVGAQEAFVADASHQLRTPLTSLRLRLELLDGSLSGIPQALGEAGQVAAALHEVARLSRLVDGLLALARAERAGASVTASVVELVTTLRERADAWTPVAAEEGVTIDVAGSSEVVARATPDRLAQVLDNLIANAVDASPTQSTVSLTAQDGPRGPELHVLDEGPGLPEDERERAFDRFWSGRSGGSRLGGTGLGLAIVRKLVEADGGTVELRQREGGGLDATVILPRAANRPAGDSGPQRSA